MNSKKNTEFVVDESALSAGSAWRKIKGFRELTVLIIIIAVSVFLSLLSPHFLTKINITTTAIGLAIDGIIAIGMTLALISGGFDLSVGSVLAFSSVTTGALFLAGMNIWLAALIGMIVALLCGIFNGYLIGKIGLNPFITTLAMMGIARGAAFVMSKGSAYSLSGTLKSFTMLGAGRLFGIPILVIIFVLMALTGDFLIRKSVPARNVFYTGSNEKGALLSGINTSNVKFIVYIVTAVLAGIGGILTLARFNVAVPTAGVGTEMRVISAAVIGGASLSGGEGTVFGTVLGIILLNLINNGLVLLNVSVYWQDLISGVILITAVIIDFMTHKRSDKLVIKKDAKEVTAI
ncbi:MAG: ABC transporter permease [Candidatus Humimicrobiaceae bacterium]